MRPLLPNGEEIPNCEFRLEYGGPSSKSHVIKRLECSDPNLHRVAYSTYNESSHAESLHILPNARNQGKPPKASGANSKDLYIDEWPASDDEAFATDCHMVSRHV